MTSQCPPLRRVLATAVFVAGLVNSATANETAEVTPKAVTPKAVTPEAVTPEASTHPLTWIFRYASSRSDYIQEHIRDYSCRLIKRERIDGTLQKHQFIQIKMRCEQPSDSEDARPMAVYMRYLAPGSLKDRRVLYVQGQNSGMMLVRKGGRSFKYVKLEIDPNGTAARRESNYPITDVGFDKIIERLVQRVAEDIKNDPTGANTLVSHFRNARVSDRICTHIRIVHPNRGDGVKFHRASLYVDDKLHVPIRLVVYDWPPSEGDELLVLEEYTYVDLQLNVGLTDADFSKSKLDESDADAARPSVARTKTD